MFFLIYGFLQGFSALTDSLTEPLLILNIKEPLQIPVTFGTFDQSDEETWPDQQKDNNEDKHNDNDKSSESDH